MILQYSPSQKTTEQLKGLQLTLKNSGPGEKGQLHTLGALHRGKLSLQSCDFSAEHLLVSRGIAMIALIKPLGRRSSSPIICTEIWAEKRLPCSWELLWQYLICIMRSQWTMMLLPMDPVKIPKDCTHTMHSILLLWPRQAKCCQGCYPKTRHIPPAWSSVSGLTWEHQEERD